LPTQTQQSGSRIASIAAKLQHLKRKKTCKSNLLIGSSCSAKASCGKQSW
jgi:hypothetical protein